MSTTITLTRPTPTVTSTIHLTKVGVFPISTLRTSLSSMGEMLDQATGENSALVSEPKFTEPPSTEKAAMAPSASSIFTPSVISAPVTDPKMYSTVTGLSPELDYLESIETAKLLVELQQRYARPTPEESISAAQPSTSRGKGRGRKRARASRAGSGSASKRRKVTTADGEVSAVGTDSSPPVEVETSEESTSDVASTSAESSSSSLTSLASDTTSQAPSRIASARRRRSPANPPEPSSIVARVKQSALEKAQAKASKALAEAQARAESA